VFSEKEGLIATFIYAVSFYMIFNDREVVPTMPVVLWTVWYFYALHLLLKGKQKLGFLISGILVGLIWHLNVALVLLLPLIPIALWLSKRKIKVGSAYEGFISFAILSVFLISFEVRHGFPQVNGLIALETAHQHDVITGWDKFIRVIHLLSKNIDGLIWGSFEGIPFEATLLLFIGIFVYFLYKKIVSKNHFVLISVWLALYVAFFSLYSKILSEYYLNGTVFIWIYIATLGISYLLSKKSLKIAGIIVLFLFAFLNFDRFFSIELPKNGYNYKKAIVSEIKEDAQKRNYPCVAVSYITDPGYQFGYRYLFYLEDLHVNSTRENTPVYTIVFPLNDELFPTDVNFGHLGLIYPDYSVYNMQDVVESCKGENENLTKPMWGLPT
jgi:4-amino-4-deoxy-L-arabinose transferase-like glycosyltransferase